MATKKEIKKHLQVALQEVGHIKPWFDKHVNSWIFSHPKYPVEYAGDSAEQVTENYPKYLETFIEERLNNNLSPLTEKETTGRGGKRLGAGRPRGSVKEPKERIYLPEDIAQWIKDTPVACEEIRSLIVKNKISTEEKAEPNQLDKKKLAELKQLLETIDSLLPTEIHFSSTSIHPSKAQIFREACLYRIAELVQSAYDCFSNKQIISAFILCRAIMETEALFWYIHDQMKTAIQKEDVMELNEIFNKVLVGAKSKRLQDLYSLPTAINVITLIKDKLGRKIDHYYDHYESLSEFTHPNGMAITRPYVKVIREKLKATFFKSEKTVSLNLALHPLIGSLNFFLKTYHTYEKTINQLTKIYEKNE